MNIESLLNYLLADAFGRVAQSVELLLEGKSLTDKHREHLVGFCQILKGQQAAPPHVSLMQKLGEFGAEQSGDDMKEMLDALRRTSVGDIANMDDEDGGVGSKDESNCDTPECGGDKGDEAGDDDGKGKGEGTEGKE